MSNRSMKRKVLLMGKSGSGKTSMRSIIFANYLALGVENSHVRFLGNLILNLWDCGGQDAFMENYFESQKDAIFRNVEVLIYVFDIESVDRKKDLDQFQSCVDALALHSKQSHVFCLIHKMDLIHKEEDRQKVYTEREHQLKRILSTSTTSTLTCFPTSIWDETLYKAWSSIVHSLIPNINQLEHHLSSFCTLLQADELVLFEKATFLVISSAVRHVNGDAHRYEKISNIIKQFKLSCSKGGMGFVGMEVRNKTFVAFLDQLTTNTYVMIVGRGGGGGGEEGEGGMLSAAVNLNVKAARPHFEKFVQGININMS